MILATTRLTLRDFTEDDHVAANRYESDPEVTRYQTHDPRTPEESLSYIRLVIAQSSQTPRRLYDMAVVLKDQSEVIGRCGLHVANPEECEAALWYVMHRDFWGRGYIPEAARALMRFGFEELGLHRIWADCDPANIASLRVTEKLGLRREAHFRENAWIKGKWTDTVISAMLDREWLAENPTT